MIHPPGTPHPSTRKRLSADHDTVPPPPSPPSPRRFVAITVLAVVATTTAVVLGAWIVVHGSAARLPAVAPPGLRAEGGALLAPAASPQLRYVAVETARLAPPLPPLPAPARVVVAESRSMPVEAPLAGRIEQVAVQLGQEVRKGAKLIAIRSSSVPEIGREIEIARAALAVRRASADRVRDLVRLRALPDKELLLAEEEQREGEIALRAAEGKRKSLHLRPADGAGLYWLEAPRAGTVVERQALVGMEVGPDRVAPLLSIADLDEVVVVADLFESDVAAIKLGQRAQVLPAGAAGTVEYVAALVDPLRHTVAVRVRVANPQHRLRPNAFAQVAFENTGGQPPRIVVPSEAVVTEGTSPQVFVRASGGAGAGGGGGAVRFERRAVKVGRSHDGKTEIIEGLTAGEDYVARGALLLLNTLDLGND